MKKIKFVSIFAALFCLLTFSYASADVIDNFDSYGTGALSSASGGVWRPWANLGVDAHVVAEGKSSPNAISLGTSSEDVVTYNNTGNLLAGGTATFSADFYIKSSTKQIAMSFVLGPGNPSDNSINYNSQIANIVIGGYGASYNEVHLWNIDTGAFPLLTTVSLDGWHSISLVAYQAGSSFFDVYIDGILEADNYNFMTAFTDPNGFNALEIYTGYVGGTSTPPSGDGFLVDNISMTGSTTNVPEPASLLLLGLGLMGLAGVRRKIKK